MRRLAALAGESVTVVHWDRHSINSSAHSVVDDPSVQFVRRSCIDLAGIVQLIRKLSPRIVYVSGWMDRDYLEAIRICRFEYKMRFFTVSGIDDKWHGSVRQYAGALYFRMRWRRLVDFFWVSGPEQYHYARHFGYQSDRILPYLLSADDTLFTKTGRFSKRFVFVGRLDPRKGIDILVEAYKHLPEALREEWPLVVIGKGSLANTCRAATSSNVRLLPFLQPEDLARELAAGGVGCFPSRNDQWGVSLQELALMGYPAVASTGYGSAVQFLIPGFNGFLYPTFDVDALSSTLKRMAELPERQLLQMSDRSRRLAMSVQLDFSAASFLSVEYRTTRGDSQW